MLVGVVVVVEGEVEAVMLVEIADKPHSSVWSWMLVGVVFGSGVWESVLFGVWASMLIGVLVVVG